MKKTWLYNKTVVVSGASGGLGFAISKLLIEKYGCKIIGIARNENKILAAKESLGENSDKFSYRLFDVSERNNWINFKNELINNNIKARIEMLAVKNNISFNKMINYLIVLGYQSYIDRFDKYYEEQDKKIRGEEKNDKEN